LQNFAIYSFVQLECALEETFTDEKIVKKLFMQLWLEAKKCPLLNWVLVNLTFQMVDYEGFSEQQQHLVER